MSLVKITLENMFGSDSSREIYVPKESKDDIINIILRNYSWIYDIFEEKNINDENLKELENVIGNLDDNFLGMGETVGMLDRDASIVSDLFARDIKIEYQKKVKSHSSYEKETIYSIPYLILFYSFFAFKSNAIPSQEKYDMFYNDDENIYEFVNGELIDGEYKSFYRFKPNNRFFEMMDMCCGEAWKTQKITHDPRGARNEFSGIDLIDLLTKGYYLNTRDNKHYILFEKDEDIDSENNLKEFVFDCIYKGGETDADNGSFTFEYSRFTINIGKCMLFGFKDQIINTFKDKITKFQQSQLGEDSAQTFCNGEIKVAVRSANTNLDFSSRYNLVFEYGFNIVKNYIEALSADTETKQKDLINDKYLRKIINTLIGATTSSALNPKLNYKTYIFDKENKGDGIFTFFKVKCEGETNGTLNILGNANYNLDLNSINKKSSEYKISEMNIVSDKETETFFKNAADLVNNDNIANVPLYFYELAVFNNFNKDLIPKTKSDLKDSIDNFCRISGNLLSKFLFFSMFDIENYDGSKARCISSTNLVLPAYRLTKKYSYNAGFINIDGTVYSDYATAYKKLNELVIEKILNIINVARKAKSSQEAVKKAAEAKTAYEEYIKSRLANGYYTEKDYFYINDSPNLKKMPVNPFVDVEFNVPECYEESGKGLVRTTWIPVSSVRASDVESENKIILNTNLSEKGEPISPIHAGTYFESFELEDKAGVKEISLTLKSSNDINLENIIYSSLSLENQIKTIESKENKISDIDEILKNSEANFRIRFGYRDISARDNENKETAINTSNIDDMKFINRVNTAKPVQVYPWTYFKITGLDSTIKDGEDTYTIKGVSCGSYMLSTMTLCGISANFSKDTNASNDDFFGSPKNVIGKLAKWITMASAESNENDEKKLTTARICFLGDKEGTLITDFDRKKNKFTSELKYELKNGGTLEGGNIESIENFFFDSTKGNKLTAKNFNIINDTKTLSVKEILDALVNWLPNRVYYIGKTDNGETLAVYLPYESIYQIENFFNTQPFKTEKMRYQVIEADAKLFRSKNEPSSDYKKTYFIRMYYEGPSRSLSEEQIEDKGEGKLGFKPYKKDEKNYLRIYNYRSLQEQVIKNIEISSNDAEFANTVSSVMMLGCGAPVVFEFDNTNGTINYDGYSATNGEKIDINGCENDIIYDVGKYSAYFNTNSEASVKPRLIFNKSDYIVSNVKDTDNFNVIASMCKNEASKFFSAMQNKLYTGEMTILGDPFYYFDSSVEAGKYEIYLQMNRADSTDGYRMVKSRYSGIYFITGIKHSINKEGEYTTTLSITKRIFGSNK